MLYQTGIYTILKQHTKEEIELEIRNRENKSLNLSLCNEKVKLENLESDLQAEQKNKSKTKINNITKKIKTCQKKIKDFERKIDRVFKEENTKPKKHNSFGFEKDNKYYSLHFPNFEVQRNIQSAIRHICERIARNFSIPNMAYEVRRLIDEDNWADLLSELKYNCIDRMFQGVTGMTNEQQAQLFFGAILFMAGLKPEVEKKVGSLKRIDLYFENNDKIYIIEFKTNTAPYRETQRIDIGFMQAYRRYLPTFLSEKKDKYVIGLNFSKKDTRNYGTSYNDIDQVNFNSLISFYMKKFDQDKREIEHLSGVFQPEKILDSSTTDIYEEELDDRPLK